VFSESALRLALGYVAAWFRWYFWAHYHRLTGREWFDHRINLHRWTIDPTRLSWVERGVYPRELMGPDSRVLDLCCGDGFYPHHFFASTAAHVDAVDFTAAAIAHARRHYRHPAVAYHVLDVVADPFPGASYDVVTWDAAIEHFDDQAVRAVLAKVVAVLKPGGVLSGSTPLVDRAAGPADPENPFHDHDYHSPEEMEALLSEFFAHVATMVTDDGHRRTIYFRASDEPARLGRFGAPR
jgi:2-polyprenyl-3-methyl-5-hydroxy-6-metoxy-1,4-benzoquinol methylase